MSSGTSCLSLQYRLSARSHSWEIAFFLSVSVNCVCGMSDFMYVTSVLLCEPYSIYGLLILQNKSLKCYSLLTDCQIRVLVYVHFTERAVT